jgi:hypothetical protein
MLETIHGWISVKDAVPAHRKEVLILENGEITTGIYDDSINLFVHILHPIIADEDEIIELIAKNHAHGHITLPCVTHWQPLPKIPQEIIDKHK